MKAEPSRLIPRKLAAKLELLFVVFFWRKRICVWKFSTDFWIYCVCSGLIFLILVSACCINCICSFRLTADLSKTRTRTTPCIYDPCSMRSWNAEREIDITKKISSSIFQHTCCDMNTFRIHMLLQNAEKNLISRRFIINIYVRATRCTKQDEIPQICMDVLIKFQNYTARIAVSFTKFASHIGNECIVKLVNRVNHCHYNNYPMSLRSTENLSLNIGL